MYIYTHIYVCVCVYICIYIYTAAVVKSLQSCLTLCDPIDGSPPGSSIPGILQTRTLEWGAISFSNACMLSRSSHVWLCVTPRSAAHQAPLSMGFSRQEYWSGLPLPSPIYILHLLYAFICQWTFRLLPCLSIINSVAMNIEVHVSFQIIVLPKCMSQSGPAGSYGNSIFVFLRNVHTVFHSGYTCLHSHQSCMMVSFSAHTCQHLSLVFLVLAILTVLFWPDTDLHGGHKELDTTEQLRTNN